MNPSWPALYQTVTKLTPSGPRGFEGLIAELFQSHFNERFFLARAGDQPSGDAYASRSGVVIQTKRYTTSTISENELVGEIHRALNTISDFDLYIVASTAPTAQLAARMREEAEEAGLDVMLLSFKDAVSEIGALCVCHWEAVAGFLSLQGDSWKDWADAQFRQANVKTHLKALEDSFACAQTKRMVAETAKEQFKLRFTREKGWGQAVSRVAIAESLMNWWRTSNSPIAVLEGEEGMGKSWSAARFAFKLTEQGGIPIFWLDSRFWTNARSPENILDYCLENTFAGQERLRKRIKRKIIDRWRDPILIVLDGANERGAWNSAEAIVQNYREGANRIREKVRLIFTTRPLSSRSPTFAQLWEGFPRFTATPFSVDEMTEVLSSIKPPLSIDQLPKNVRQLAAIPRYLQLCVELRDQLASLVHVTTEMLLWLDLKQKIAAADVQIRTIHDRTAATPEQFLAEVANVAGWPPSNEVEVPRDRLRQLFPQFDSIQNDLLEQRVILVGASFQQVLLNGSHVILGWALWLKQLAVRGAAETREDLREKIMRQLEPAASNDLKAKALQVAALLAFLDPETSAVGFARSLLLELWIKHHNAFMGDGALDFFAEQDTVAYADTIEELFKVHFGGNLEKELAVPIARIWKEESEQFSILRQIVERWLRLIYPGGIEGSRDKKELPPPPMVPAATLEQVRLTYLAISIISLRPIPEMLPALLDSCHSQEFCYVDREGSGKIHRIPGKWSSEALGYLLRWNYSESVIADVGEYVKRNISDPSELENAQWFARLFRSTELPDVLGEPVDIYGDNELRPASDVEKLRKWLSGDSINGWRARIGFGTVGRWAVRQDLPALSATETSLLIEEMGARLKEPLKNTFSGTAENHEFEDLVPWCARLAPELLARLSCDLWLRMTSDEHFTSAAYTLADLGLGYPEIAEYIEQIVENIAANAKAGGFETTFVASVTQIVMSLGSLEQGIKWLHWMEHRTLGVRDTPLIGLLPLPLIISTFHVEGLAAYARTEIDHLWKRINVEGRTSTDWNRLSHWLQVYAFVTEPDQDLERWALEMAGTPNVPEKCTFPLFLIVARSRNLEILLGALRLVAFQRFQDGFHAWRWGAGLSSLELSGLSYEAIKDVSTLSTSGWLLYNRSTEGLVEWGRDVMAFANTALENGDPLVPIATISQEIDPSGKLGSIQGERLPPRETSYHATETATWGIDRVVDRPGPTDEQQRTSQLAVHDEIARRRELRERAIVEFNDFEPFSKACKENPSEFAAYAVRFFQCYEKADPNRRMNFSCFASMVYVLLLKTDTEAALKIDLSCFGPGGLTDSTTGLLWISGWIWDKSLNENQNILRVREDQLMGARNDEALLQIVLSALKHNCVNGIEALASKFLESLLARERALGVTILAFLGGESGVKTLSGFVENDKSFWVRKQAAWSLEVCRTELACRTHYARLLDCHSLGELTSMLVVLRSALTPTAKIWHIAIEETNGCRSFDEQMEGYLQLFWHKWEHCGPRRSSMEIMGRKLAEFSRGEPLKEGVSSQQAPWWDPF